MNKFQIVAQHMAFGTVVFVIEAGDDKAAFSKWKNVVFSGRQWIVKSNTKVSKQTFNEQAPADGVLPDNINDL